MNREKSRRINVYRLREQSHFDDIDLQTSGYSLEHSNKHVKFYIQTRAAKPPDWVDFFRQYIVSNIEKIVNKACSFVFLYRNSTNAYALTGGYGHTRLKPFIDDEFGVDVAVRMIDENGLTALGQKSMKGHTRQIYRAVAGYNPLFDRENYTRILDAVEGKAEFEGKKFRVLGRSSLALRTIKDVEHIEEVFNEIEEILGKPAKIEFPKSYKLVVDDEIISQLDEAAVAMLEQYWNDGGDRERLYLEFKNPFIQFRCDNYEIRYKRQRIEITEFDLDVIRSKLIEGGLEKIDNRDDFASIRFSGKDDAGQEQFKDELFFDLLICELRDRDKTFIKVRRKWYQILDEISRFIDEQLRLIPVDRGLMPDWDPVRFKEEKEYNLWVAGNKGWSCLDEDFIYMPEHSKIEVCDLFNSVNKQFIHVKKTWGSKSAYLFTQGITAAEYFRNSAEFRGKCKEKWSQLFDGHLDRAEIVFGIADNKANRFDFPLNMTYFAKLNLYNAVFALKQMDFEVRLAPIALRGDR